MNITFPANINCIVVGPDHYNTLNVLRSIGQEGFEAYLILISPSSKCIVTTSKYARFGKRLASYSDILSFLMNIGQILDTKIPLITTNDKAASAVDSHFKELSTYFYMPNCAYETGNLTTKMDKGLQVLVAEQHGFKIPKSFSLDLTKNNIPAELEFPCIVKSLKSINGSKSNIKICNNLQDLLEHLYSIREKVGTCQIQEFIPNDKFFLVGGVRLPNNTTIIPGIIEKLKFGHKNHNLGLSAFGRLSPINEMLKTKCKAILEDIDYYGPFSFEFVYSQQYSNNIDDLYFIELNLRTDGLFYFYDKAKISLSTLWINYFVPHKELISDIEIKTPLYGMSETLYISEYLKPSMIISAIKDLFKARGFCYFNRKDIRPFLAKFFKIN